MYNDIISLKNLHEAWVEFVSDKKHKKDVTEFALCLPRNISILNEELKYKTYRHGKYEAFSINDPKPRIIHKASVLDRLLHHSIHRVLYPQFDKKFIYDSYSCRNFKGTHRALNRFRDFGKSVSFNHTKTVWVLKCDIRKFFASVDHGILLEILEKHIKDKDTLWLLERVVGSFESAKNKEVAPLRLADSALPLKEGERKRIGLPLGNLTSQLLVNIYMNEFDQFVKHELKVKYYIRYADDFVVLDQNKEYLRPLLSRFSEFLSKRLKLSLHPDKVFIKTLASGVDFLGWVHFPTHRVLRTVTKRRMFKRVNEKNVSSYLGLCKHGNAFALSNEISRQFLR